MGGRRVGNSVGAVLLSVFSGEYRLLAKDCGFFVQNGCGLAYPRCGKTFRPVALCLAEIEPFDWHSDSCNTVIGSVK